jgi:arylsulfatase A-like enzyme
MSHYAVHKPFQRDPRFAAHYRNSERSYNAKNFATMVEGVDRSLGDILDELDRQGVAERTLVFFLGDNGTRAPLGNPRVVASAAPLRGRKATKFEGGTRVPFIVAWAKDNPKNVWQQKLPIARGAAQGQVASVGM